MQFHRRNITSQALPADLAPDGPRVLNALRCDDHLKIFFAPSLDRSAMPLADHTEVAETVSVGGNLMYRMWPKDGNAFGLTETQPEHDLLAGLNVALAIRNDERPEIIRDWLVWHRRHHGMQGALILDRAAPAKAVHDANAIETLLRAEPMLDDVTVVMLHADVPLGHPDLGHESHPMNAPDAPGKDRMDKPAPDPWHAPIIFGAFYDMARLQFLSEARAVATLDPLDILPIPEPGHPTVFDAAQAASDGVIQLVGHRAYPWAIRPDTFAEFGDHICLRFDEGSGHARWCVAPAISDKPSTWRWRRVVGKTPPRAFMRFYRCMALRYGDNTTGGQQVSRLVPKSSLIESEALLELAKHWGAKPRRLPDAKTREKNKRNDDVAIITTMKNEGPFILEWLAYHRVIGVKKFLVYTNDCTDGTDTFLQLLARKGYVEHRENPFREMDLKPQHAALADGEKQPIMKKAGWVICMDVDEYINIHTGDGTLEALFAAAPDANMISMTWRLFGNADVHPFDPAPIIGQFDRCAPQMARKPHQAWGFKTLFRNIGLFKKFGVHRPKGLKPQLVDEINWINGSGAPMPEKDYRTAWRSTTDTVGYDLVTLNHYAVRSAESFLVKRDRGRVNHVERDQGLAYWFRMNNNYEQDRSIMRMLPAVKAEMAKMLADPEISAAHDGCIAAHRAHIDRLMDTPNYRAFYGDITGTRMERLSRMHLHFGANVFLAGPDVIPDDVIQADISPQFFFTVEKTETQH